MDPAARLARLRGLRHPYGTPAQRHRGRAVRGPLASLDDRDPRGEGATTPSWRAEADPAALDGFGHDMDMGDLGGMYFFVCRGCPDTPYAHRYDC